MNEAHRSPVVVITGASAGLGRATAKVFARNGWRVGLLARGQAGLAGAAEDVHRLGGEPMELAADVADAQAVAAAAERVASTWGGIDVWVNNAMATVIGAIDEIAPEEYRRVTEVTYLGVVHGTLAALNHMRRQGHGTIVQVGSALAYRSIPLQAPYCAAKAAARAFTDTLRAELEHEASPIRVTAVHMPGMNTPQFEWARLHVRRVPRPVAPVFDPEAAAESVFRAAIEAPRELWVGGSTVQAVLGQMAMPGILDRLLARKAWGGQMTGRSPPPDRPDNLYQPAEGDHGVHGPYGEEQRPSVVTYNPTVIRAVGLMTLAALAAQALLGRRRS